MVKRHYGIRTQRYKLIHFYNDADYWELYDMKKDSNELNNVYGKPEYKKVQEDMTRLLLEMQKEYKDTDPTEQNIKFFKGDDGANMH